MNELGTPSGPRWQTQYGIGVVLLLLAAALWIDARHLPVSPAVGVGPTAALRLVGALLTALGLAHFVSAWRARQQSPTQSVDRGNKTSLALVMAALVGQILIIEVGGGFILSSAWLFTLTARGFGERIRLKMLAIGATLAIAIYLFFTKALSLALPAGPLERLLA